VLEEKEALKLYPYVKRERTALWLSGFHMGQVALCLFLYVFMGPQAHPFLSVCIAGNLCAAIIMWGYKLHQNANIRYVAAKMTEDNKNG